MFCRVSGCLTDGQIFLSASEEEMVSINTRDTMGIRMLQREKVEVGVQKTKLGCAVAYAAWRQHANLYVTVLHC